MTDTSAGEQFSRRSDGLWVPTWASHSVPGAADLGWAREVRSSRRALMRAWFRLCTYGPLVVAFVALSIELPRVLGGEPELAGRRLDVGYGLDPSSAATALAVPATIVVAVALAARTTSRPGVFVAAREILSADVAGFAGAASSVLATTSLVHGFTHPGDLIPSATLTALGIVLSALAVAAVPSRAADQQQWARALDLLTRRSELARFGRLAERWTAPEHVRTRAWLCAETGRWVTVTVVLAAGTAWAIGGRPSWRSFLAVVALVALNTALSAVVIHSIIGVVTGLLDQSPVSAVLAGLMAVLYSGVLALTLALQVLLAMPASPAQVWLLAPLLAVAAAGVVSGVAGRDAARPGWRWFRLAWVVRRGAHRHCARRLAALAQDHTSTASGWDRGPGRITRWYEKVTADPAADDHQPIEVSRA